MHRLIKNRLLPALALAAALISPSAHAQAASSNDPIKLGLIDIYSGGFAFIADSIRTGFQIAVDEANAAGGLKGRPFQLVSADMGGQVEKAVTEGRRMILEDKIKFVTVGIHSGAAIAVGGWFAIDRRSDRKGAGRAAIEIPVLVGKPRAEP